MKTAIRIGVACLLMLAASTIAGTAAAQVAPPGEDEGGECSRCTSCTKCVSAQWGGDSCNYKGKPACRCRQ